MTHQKKKNKKDMNILFINPNPRPEWTQDKTMLYFPLGLCNVASEVERLGYRYDILDLMTDPLTPEDLDELETLLLRSDAGVDATDQIINALRTRLNEEVLDSKEGMRFLKEQLCQIVDKPIAAIGYYS